MIKLSARIALLRNLADLATHQAETAEGRFLHLSEDILGSATAQESEFDEPGFSDPGFTQLPSDLSHHSELLHVSGNDEGDPQDPSEENIPGAGNYQGSIDPESSEFKEILSFFTEIYDNASYSKTIRLLAAYCICKKYSSIFENARALLHSNNFEQTCLAWAEKAYQFESKKKIEFTAIQSCVDIIKMSYSLMGNHNNADAYSRKWAMRLLKSPEARIGDILSELTWLINFRLDQIKAQHNLESMEAKTYIAASRSKITYIKRSIDTLKSNSNSDRGRADVLEIKLVESMSTLVNFLATRATVSLHYKTAAQFIHQIQSSDYAKHHTLSADVLTNSKIKDALIECQKQPTGVVPTVLHTHTSASGSSTGTVLQVPATNIKRYSPIVF